jgi:hypothetical protein
MPQSKPDITKPVRVPKHEDPTYVSAVAPTAANQVARYNDVANAMVALYDRKRKKKRK